MREHDLASQPTVEPGGSWNETVAMVQEAVRVDQQPTIDRRGPIKSPRQRGADSIALERERLDVRALPSVLQIVLEPGPKFTRVHKQFDVHDHPPMAVSVDASAIISRAPVPNRLPAHANAPNRISRPALPNPTNRERRIPSTPAARLTP